MISPATSGIEFPAFYRVVQRFDDSFISDVSAAVRLEFDRLNLSSKVRAGERVAVAVGSRGIYGLSKIVAEVVSFLKSIKLDPFIFPAMGSHGGATALGQQLKLIT